MAAPGEVAAMRRAIALSAAGLGTTSPNPPVGCVVLDPAGVVVGEGYHERKGEAHAEAQALAAAGPLADGATAVVTLEPCNHQGRTAPCRQALIDARVRRVVIGMIDPTSRGEGGAAALRAAGVDVETGVLADEARVVLGSWLAALEARRPVLTWPYMISGSGIVALPGGMEDSWRLRLNADAVLYAGGSVTEAMPGSHGPGILDVKDVPAGSAASAVLASLYEGGVRRLLLDGGLEVAAPLLAAGLVDRVLAYLADGAASRRPGVALPWPLLPPGFAITGAWRVREFVRIEGEPEKTRLEPDEIISIRFQLRGFGLCSLRVPRWPGCGLSRGFGSRRRLFLAGLLLPVPWFRCDLGVIPRWRGALPLRRFRCACWMFRWP
jgi:diaminohydroxyphosphoribosylaminopyrimidine deaminase/5-amino-6-(5-phosphoribosylamino)uracil reductase